MFDIAWLVTLHVFNLTSHEIIFLNFSPNFGHKTIRIRYSLRVINNIFHPKYTFRHSMGVISEIKPVAPSPPPPPAVVKSAFLILQSSVGRTKGVGEGF